MTKNVPRKTGFEASLAKLEAAVEQLESGELALDEALKVFSVGVKEAQRCQKALQDVELKVEQLLNQGDGSFSRGPFHER